MSEKKQVSNFGTIYHYVPSCSRSTDWNMKVKFSDVDDHHETL